MRIAFYLDFMNVDNSNFFECAFSIILPTPSRLHASKQ